MRFDIGKTDEDKTEIIMDVDGNVYHTVKIGHQVWTVENLRTTKYNDGTEIPDVWRRAPAYCWHNNDSNNKNIYGALYNWYAVDSKKLAPTGWHVPTNTDWDTLQNYLIANGYNWDGTTTGNKIAKALSAGTDWHTSSKSGAIGNNLTQNNESGFSALPGGIRGEFGDFSEVGTFGYWWSATECDESNAYHSYLHYSEQYLYRLTFYKHCGYSVRIVRD